MNNEKNKNNRGNKNDNKNENNNAENDNDNKYKNSVFRPNNSGLINHLKKENERLRKLVISYEFKNKRYNNINNIYNTNKNNTDFLISKSNFEILKKCNYNENQLNNNNTYTINTNKNKKDIKIISKYNFSNKSIGSIRKIKNITKVVKKPEIKKIKDINMFDNDYNYIKEKENRFPRYNDFKIINNTKIDRTTSLSQRKRKIFNIDNTGINANALRIKSIVNVNNKNLHNNVLLQYKNLSGSRSLSKLMKRKKINEYSFNNSLKIEKKTIGVINSYAQHLNMIKNQSNKNKIMKTIENKRNENSSLDKELFFSSTSRQSKHTHIIKKNNKNNGSKKEVYYQKPIINKITIYNNINNGNNNYPKQKIHLNVQAGKIIVGKKYNKNDNYFKNYTVGI